MNKPTTKKEYELHNMEIINNNFPERMNLLIPCSCGKSFKAQDGHFFIGAEKRYPNSLGKKNYKGFYWHCREQSYRRRTEYEKRNQEKKREWGKLSRKGNKYSCNVTIKAAIRTHNKRFPNEICIFKQKGKFISSKVWKEVLEYNKQIINNLLEKQNNKCALTGDLITESTMSIDRIDSNHGYTEGNIQLTTWEANRFKRDYTEKELFHLALKIFNTLGMKPEFSRIHYEYCA